MSTIATHRPRPTAGSITTSVCRALRLSAISLAAGWAVPVLKNKLFFFFDFNDSKIVQSSPEDTTVPLDSYRNGNVSYILATANNGTGACSFTSRANTTPQCIGVLTPAQVKAMDPQGTGESSVIETFLSARYPHANDLNSGDGNQHRRLPLYGAESGR